MIAPQLFPAWPHAGVRRLPYPLWRRHTGSALPRSGKGWRCRRQCIRPVELDATGRSRPCDDGPALARDRLDPILDQCVTRYREDLDQDGQVRFRGNANRFARTYGSLYSVLTCSNMSSRSAGSLCRRGSGWPAPDPCWCSGPCSCGRVFAAASGSLPGPSGRLRSAASGDRWCCRCKVGESLDGVTRRGS